MQVFCHSNVYNFFLSEFNFPFVIEYIEHETLVAYASDKQKC